MRKVYKIVLTIMVISLSVYASAMLTPDEAVYLFINLGYNVELFNQREFDINRELTEKEAQARYNRIVTMDANELKRALANSCLSNPVLENLHYFLDEKGEILPDNDILLLDDYKESNGRLNDLDDEIYKDDIDDYKRIYSILNFNIKKEAVKDKIITDLWLGPNSSLAASSVIDNKRLRYVKIDPHVEEINETAFQNNPNIEAYHVCSENYDIKNRNNVISYHIVQVPGEVPPIAFIMDDVNNTVKYFLKTIYRNNEILFFDAYTKEYYYMENRKLYKLDAYMAGHDSHNNYGFDGSREKSNNYNRVDEINRGREYQDIVLIGGAYRDSYVYTVSNTDEVITRYIDYNGVLCEKGDSKEGPKLLFYPVGRKDESYVVPDGIEQIGDVAFKNAKNLKTVTIPQSVKKIGYNSFSGTKLTLIVKKNSYAEKYAKGRNIKIQYIKKEKTTD